MAPIRLETGRYERLPKHERIVLIVWKENVESETRVLIECVVYNDTEETYLI